MRVCVWTIVLVCLTACGAGAYGYARTYVPLSDEHDLSNLCVNLTYEEVRRTPELHRETLLGWFGVVTAVVPIAGSSDVNVSMTYRAHQERHLCADERQDSCRVTVSERPGGTFTARLSLRPEEHSGPDRLSVGSLVRLYGTPTGELDDNGGPVLASRYYRHWPRREYVTTGAARSMRR